MKAHYSDFASTIEGELWLNEYIVCAANWSQLSQNQNMVCQESIHAFCLYFGKLSIF